MAIHPNHIALSALLQPRHGDLLAGIGLALETIRSRGRKLRQCLPVVIADVETGRGVAPLPAGEEVEGTAAGWRNAALGGAGLRAEGHGTGSRAHCRQRPAAG